MKPSETPSLIESLEDLENLFILMRNYSIGIVEVGGMKFVREPEVVVPTAVRGNAVPDMPAQNKPIHADPFLYADGVVPSF